MSPLLVILIVFGALAVPAITIYNGLIRLRNESESALSGIDVQLKRRADLVPNLVEAVKGYAAHESRVLEAVAEARTAALRASNVHEMEDADRQMEQAVGSLFALAESYPDLKASEQFSNLQGELADTEDKVAAARRYYNAVVQRLNSRVQSIPYNVVAALARIGAREFFRLEDERDRGPVTTTFTSSGGAT